MMTHKIRFTYEELWSLLMLVNLRLDKTMEDIIDFQDILGEEVPEYLQEDHARYLNLYNKIHAMMRSKRK